MWKLISLVLPLKASSFSIHVIGDWGRRGQLSQLTIAERMHSLVYDAVISVGDNFYPDGLETNQDDHIRESWLDVYSPTASWYVALGNHDYHGNVSAQMTIVNPYWNMPNNVYDFSIQDHTFVVLDSTVIDEVQYRHVDELLTRAGPHKWIVAHHPIVSAGHHDVERKYQDQMVSLYRKHGVLAILSGHDHSLQYLEWNGVRQIISGAGSSVEDIQYPQEGLQFFENKPGFVNMLFSKESVRVTFLGEASELFSVYIPF